MENPVENVDNSLLSKIMTNIMLNKFCREIRGNYEKAFRRIDRKKRVPPKKPEKSTFLPPGQKSKSLVKKEKTFLLTREGMPQYTVSNMQKVAFAG